MIFLSLPCFLVGGVVVVGFALFENAVLASGAPGVRMLRGPRGGGAAENPRERLPDALELLIPARLGVGFGLGLAVLGLLGLRGPAASVIPGGEWAVPAAGLGLCVLVREAITGGAPLKDPTGRLARLLPWFRRWERLAWPLATPLARLRRRLFPTLGEPDDEATERDVEDFIETGAEEGIIEKREEAEMVRGALDLDETLVREAMTPRPKVISVESTATVSDVRRLILESRHRKIPVFDDGSRVKGAVDAVDLVGVESGDDALSRFVRKVPVVPETKKADELLAEFKQTRETFAVVVDEHGSVSGIATLRDITDEVVGEVLDDPARGEDDVVPAGEDAFIVLGRAELDEVQRISGFEAGEIENGAPFDTMSGFVLAVQKRIPREGESMEHGGFTLVIEEADERSVRRVRLTRGAGRDG